MENNMKMPAIAITVVIGLIVLGSVLMPVLNDARATTSTLENAGYFRMQKIIADDTADYTLEWVKDTDVLTLNGTRVNLGDSAQYRESGVSIALTDKSISRYQSGLRVQSWIQNVGGSTGYSASTVKINFNNGTETITVDQGLPTEDIRTTTYQYAYFASNTGNYAMKDKDATAYVKADSELYAVGVTNINNTTAPDSPVLSVLKMTGDASSVNFSVLYGATDTTFSNVNIVKTANANYVGIFDLDKVTATATYDGANTDITYSYFVVPYELTAEKAQHLSDGARSVLGAIPVIIIVGLLLLIISVYKGREY